MTPEERIKKAHDNIGNALLIMMVFFAALLVALPVKIIWDCTTTDMCKEQHLMEDK